MRGNDKKGRAADGNTGGGGRGREGEGIRYEIEHLSRDVPRAAALIGHFEAREEAMPMPCPRIIGLPLRGGGEARCSVIVPVLFWKSLV